MKVLTTVWAILLCFWGIGLVLWFMNLAKLHLLLISMGG